MKKLIPQSANILFACNTVRYNSAVVEINNDKNKYAFNGNRHNNVTTKIRCMLNAFPVSILLTGLVVLWCAQPAYGQAIKSSYAKLDSVTTLLRLKLYVDQYDYDDIAIGFNSGASLTYNPNEDSGYMPGVNAAEGLASYSKDGVRLSVNLLPLPGQNPEHIRLYVVAANNGAITLKRTKLDSLPKKYNLWLVDRYKKDSINLRVDSSYVFEINKADTASFGGYRFYVSVSQTPVITFRLLGFKAIKAPGGAQLLWTTQNEENSTRFTVERSADGGRTFTPIDSLTSASLNTYSFTDPAPPATTDIYRLKITDVNDIVSYSNAITLVYGTMVTIVTGAINIYPNPVSGMLNVAVVHGTDSSANPAPDRDADASPLLASSTPKAPPVYNIRIITITGSVVSNVMSPSGIWKGDVSRLSPGTYVLRVTDISNSKVVGIGTFIKM